MKTLSASNKLHIMRPLIIPEKITFLGSNFLGIVFAGEEFQLFWREINN